jgi:hypothetical protein
MLQLREHKSNNSSDNRGKYTIWIFIFELLEHSYNDRTLWTLCTFVVSCTMLQIDNNELFKSEKRKKCCRNIIKLAVSLVRIFPHRLRSVMTDFRRCIFKQFKHPFLSTLHSLSFSFEMKVNVQEKYCKYLFPLRKTWTVPLKRIIYFITYTRDWLFKRTYTPEDNI